MLQLIIICPKLVSECQPHTYEADNGKDNLRGRQCKEETKKAPGLFPEECHIAGQRVVVRQMTLHEAFLIMITLIGLEPIIGETTRMPYSYICNKRKSH